MHTSLPTSQIEFINKQICNRVDQVINATQIPSSVEASALKKRAKSNLKGTSPEKKENQKLIGILNRSITGGDTIKNTEPEKLPARINDLIQAANSG
jgi:hypothetical protein